MEDINKNSKKCLMVLYILCALSISLILPDCINWFTHRPKIITTEQGTYIIRRNNENKWVVSKIVQTKNKQFSFEQFIGLTPRLDSINSFLAEYGDGLSYYGLLHIFTSDIPLKVLGNNEPPRFNFPIIVSFYSEQDRHDFVFTDGKQVDTLVLTYVYPELESGLATDFKIVKDWQDSTGEKLFLPLIDSLSTNQK
ncbi:MAG: hypothetical protein WC545_02980 [Patescibacteria group bacterium]